MKLLVAIAIILGITGVMLYHTGEEYPETKAKLIETIKNDYPQIVNEICKEPDLDKGK